MATSAFLSRLRRILDWLKSMTGDVGYDLGQTDPGDSSHLGHGHGHGGGGHGHGGGGGGHGH